MSAGGKLFLVGWLLLTVAAPLAMFPQWADFAGDKLYILGRLSGLVGLAVCLAQPLGMSQPGVRLLGAQRLPLHKYGGISGLALLLAHPLLLAVSEGDWALFSYDVSPAIWAGKISLVLMLAATGAFLFVKLKKLRFATFSQIHNIAFIAALLGLMHAYFAGTSLRDSPALLAYYLILAVTGLMVFTASKIRKLRERLRKSSKITGAP